MQAYDTEFRGEVLTACDTNGGRRSIALRFKVSESWVRRIQQQRRETGKIAPPKAAPRRPKWHAWADRLVAKIAVYSPEFLGHTHGYVAAEADEESE
jgi:transposase